MFSQFRHAVENLAAPVRQSLEEANNNEGNPRRESISRSNSIDSQPRSSSSMSSSQLADSARSNLRKSLSTQRPASPVTPPTPRTASGTRARTTLEDRLRAAAAARSPSPSTSASPPSASVAKRVISPHDVPLPDSPAQSPIIRPVTSTNDVEQHSLNAPEGEVAQAELPKPDSDEAQPFKESQQTTLPDSKGTEDKSSSVAPAMVVAADHSSLLPSEEVSGTSENPSDDSVASSSVADEAAHAKEEEEPTKAPKAPTLDKLDADNKHSKPVTLNVQAEEGGMLSSTPIPLVTPSTEASQVEPEMDEPPEAAQAAHIEDIQERLRQVEQRFLDVSASYKQLQAEKEAANLILKELTPLGGIEDDDAFRTYLHDISTKIAGFQIEVKDLNNRLQVQETRMEDIRDMHILESASQSDHIQRLKTQLEEAEALLAASQKADTQADEKLASKQAELEQVLKDLAKAQTTAKEEEEKRVKAISLLKTVRQKLVKAEKEKEDGTNELQQLRERLKGDKEKEQAVQLKFETELNTKLQAKDEVIHTLKSQHEKEKATLKERHERELAAVKGQADLEWSALKATHDQEISFKTATVQSLESALHTTREEKNNLFDTLQIRQAELESAQSHLEVLQSQNTELRYQLREAEEKADVLREDLADLQREQQARLHDPAPSANEVALLISATEAKYESRIQEMRRNFSNLERERDETDAEWSRKFDEKARETEELKRLAGSAATLTEQHRETVSKLEEEIAKLRGESRLLQQQLADLQQSNITAQEVEKKWRSQAQEWDDKIATLEQQLEEAKQRETQLRAGNKTLREEMKKVQSSAAILERQRGPGMGLWASRTAESNGNASPVSVASPGESPSRPASPAPKRAVDDQEVNLEYLRNVIFQFLEHKEMRPNLVRVLSTILHFTPQETRRLIAKV